MGSPVLRKLDQLGAFGLWRSQSRQERHVKETEGVAETKSRHDPGASSLYSRAGELQDGAERGLCQRVVEGEVKYSNTEV